jgi:hypothetical protein
VRRVRLPCCSRAARRARSLHMRGKCLGLARLLRSTCACVRHRTVSRRASALCSRMDSQYRTTLGRRAGLRTRTFRRRALATLYWAFAIVLLVVYCGARSHAGVEHWGGISRLIKWREPLRAEDGAALAAKRDASRR